jgi:hypothetical protein
MRTEFERTASPGPVAWIRKIRGTPEGQNPEVALISIKFDLAVSLCGGAMSNSKTADLHQK